MNADTKENIEFHLAGANFFLNELRRAATAVSPLRTREAEYFAFAFRACGMSIRYFVRQNHAKWYQAWNSDLKGRSMDAHALWRAMGKRRGKEQHGSTVTYIRKNERVPIHDQRVEAQVISSGAPGVPLPAMLRPQLLHKDGVPGTLIEQSEEYNRLLVEFADRFITDDPEESSEKKTIICPNCRSEFEI